MKFITMQVNSAYSLLNSTIHLSEYVTLGKKLGYEALALTDQGVLHGVIEFYQLCLKEQIQPIIGCQFRIPSVYDSQRHMSILVYAKDEMGYRGLMALSTLYQNIPLQVKQFKKMLQQYSQHLKLIHSDHDSEWGALIDEQRFDEIDALLQAYQSEWQEIEQVWAIRPEWLEHRVYQQIVAHTTTNVLPYVPHRLTHYLRTEDDYSWRILQAIDQQVQVEQHQVDVTGPYYLHEAHAETRLFDQYDSALLQRLDQFTRDLKVEIPLHQTLLPKFPLPTGETSSATYLRSQCYNGLEKRGLANDPIYIERLEHELSVIHEMGFDDYFLIVGDIIAFAHSNHIQTGAGRGSAAGSLVAYALSITQVDPIKYQLLFERFLNLERYTMPDIDLDFPDNKREQILQYVYQRYGRNHVAQIATFGTLAAKQALRDVGRVMGISQVEASQWSRAIPNQLGIKLADAIKQSTALQELVQRSPKDALLFDTAKRIEGLPRHISTHAAGVVISEDPLVESIPLISRHGEMAITQYTMAYVEAIGLLKMDFLGLRNLTILADSLELVAAATGEQLDPQAFPLDDPMTLKLFQQAYTNGIFQFESDGIRQVLKRVAPTSIEDIAAVNALYRPGPMEQIDKFVKRKQKQSAIAYPHDDLEPILAKTYGVMVYQEQVMQVTSKMAGFTLGEADILRRAMSKKDHQKMEEQRLNFMEGAQKKGYSQAVATTVYDYIERFANYGFNRSHAFAYSMLAYQLAYLKAHYPTAFFAALLKSTSATSTKAQDYLVEAKQVGIAILPPSIQKSMMDYSIDERGIITGLSAIKGLRKDFLKYIIQNRQQIGPFKDFMDLGFRMGKKYCKDDNIAPLIFAGALDEFGETRASLMETLAGLVESVHYHGDNLVLEISDELFPKFIRRDEYELLELLAHEERVLGYTLSAHPTEEFMPAYQQNIVQAVANIFEKKRVKVLGLIKSVKRIRTKKGELMAFATLQDYSGTIELILFPNDYPRYYQLLEEQAFVFVTGQASLNRNDEWQIQIHSIQPFEQFKAHYQDTSVNCYIKIAPEHQTKEVFDQLKSTLARFPGGSPVYLYLVASNQTIRAKFTTGVHLSKQAQYEIERITGIGTVRSVGKK